MPKDAKPAGGKMPIAYIAAGVAILAIVGYFALTGGYLGGGASAGFGVDVNTGNAAVEAAAKAAPPDTNAFDQANPYGYKNPLT